LSQLRVPKSGEPEFGRFDEPASPFPAQSLGTLVLAELLWKSRDDALRQPAQLALNQLLQTPAAPDDGWYWLAVRSARLAGLKFDAAELAERYSSLQQVLDARVEGQDPGLRKRVVTTALLRHFALRRDATDPTALSALLALSEWGPRGEQIYLLHGQAALLAAAIPHHTNWNDDFCRRFITRQSQGFHTQGSWPPDRDDPLAVAGGRLYSTAMSILCLEAYYRHLHVARAVEHDE
jgi:hypothetical protein